MQYETGSPTQPKTSNVLESDRIGSLLIKLTLPAFIGMFVQAMYNVVNTIFIGQFVGPLAIAGLSIVFPLQMFTMGMGMMIGMGGSSVISRLLGSGNIRQAERAVGNGITAGVVIALVLITAILVPIDFWLRFIGASDEVLPFAREYLTIIISFSLFNTLSIVLLNFVRSEGNARVGMVGMLIGAVLNIILDAVFIIHFHWGVKGAALGTGISQTVSLIYLGSYYLTGNSYLKIRIRNLRPDFSILKPMFSVGIASFVQTMAGCISSILVNQMVVRYGGDMALGAFGIIQRLMMFATMPAIVIGHGSQPILGFNYGAKRYGLILKTIRIGVMVSTSFSLAAFLVLILVPRPVIGIFTSDPELLSNGVFVAKNIFLSLPLIGLIMLGSMIFQAIGKSVQAFTTAIVRPIVFLLPLAMLLSPSWGLKGIFLAFPFSDVLALLLTLFLIVPIFRHFRKASSMEKKEQIQTVPDSAILNPRQSDPLTD